MDEIVALRPDVIVPIGNAPVAAAQHATATIPIVMVAFDLLYLNGYDLRKLPLSERKALLRLSSIFNSARASR
jgi:ATP-dependent DNA ligase